MYTVFQKNTGQLSSHVVLEVLSWLEAVVLAALLRSCTFCLGLG